MTPQDEQMLALATEEMRQLDTRAGVILELGTVQALLLIAQLQLALRHPANRGPGAAFALNMTREIEAHLGKTPGLRWLIARGWDPSYDVPA
jgi:hypothetical protein